MTVATSYSTRLGIDRRRYPLGSNHAGMKSVACRRCRYRSEHSPDDADQEKWDYTFTNSYFDGREDILVGPTVAGHYLVADGGDSYYERLPDRAEPLVLKSEADDRISDLLARMRRLDEEVDNRQGEINTIIEHCWHTGIQYDPEIDDDQIDYPIRVIHELRAEVRRLTPREITTLEELEALPVGVVVHSDEGCVWERDISGWYEPGARHGCVASDIALPAAVLYLPEGGE